MFGDNPLKTKACREVDKGCALSGKRRGWGARRERGRRGARGI